MSICQMFIMDLPRESLSCLNVKLNWLTITKTWSQVEAVSRESGIPHGELPYQEQPAHLSSCLVSLSGYVEQVDLGIETTQATPGCWTQNQLGEASGWSDGARLGVTAWPALQSCGMRWPLNNNTLVLPWFCHLITFHAKLLSEVCNIKYCNVLVRQILF